MPLRALLSLVMLVTSAQAAEPMCGTSVENEQRVRAVHERSRARVRANAGEAVPLLRDGAFYVPTDETITPGYRPLDLVGQSVVFTPAAGNAYSVRREPLRYVEPSGDPARNFQSASGAGWHYVTRDLAAAYTILGRSVTRVYVSAFNGIHLDLPAEQGGSTFDAIEAAVHRGALVSPLMITTRKPRYLLYPQVWIEETPTALIVTWRSSGNAPFGYDVQAEVRRDGEIAFSYRAVTAMRWGTPVLTAGFDPLTASRALLRALDDGPDTVTSQVPLALRAMLNVQRVEVFRLRDSDLFAVRVRLGERIDRAKLGPGEVLGFQAVIGTDAAVVEIDRDKVQVSSFSGVRLDVDGASARVDGDVVELYGIQPEPEVTAERAMRVTTFYRPLNRITDQLNIGIPFTPPAQVTTRDLSALSPAAALPLPLAEPFALGVFNPLAVWERLQKTHAVSGYDWDAIAMYQSFYTDIIFYAGAYAMNGNPQVDGIAPQSGGYNSVAPRSPTLLHMNQLTYNYSAAEDTGSKVMLHEFGHRWLYFFTIREGNDNVRALNPASGHPAAYVHTASAFPVYGQSESSVMGGAHFTLQGDGTYKARAANMGYSWTDLYLMGLAAPEEVPPWFYLAGTDLPREYWPADGVVVSGQRRDVTVSQIVAAHGPRRPSAAMSQKKFRVLFVLVTEEGTEPTAAEVAKLNEWRAVMKRNFELATGGRATLWTEFVQPAKKRAVR